MKRILNAEGGMWPAARALAVLASLGSAAWAQTKDYSGGFAKLYTLGLPDVRQAQYVRLEGSGMGDDSDTYRLRLSGNAWMLTEPKAGQPGRFVVGQARVAELYKWDDLVKLQREERRKTQAQAANLPPEKAQAMLAAAAEGELRQGGRWKAADLTNDVRKIVAALAVKKEGERSRSMEDYELRESVGRYFVFAANVCRKGYTNDANALVDALFQRTGDGRQVIAAGLNYIADAQYDGACEAFRQTRDWAAYHQALGALLARYPAGWRRAGVVKKLDGLVAAKLQSAAIPPVAGEGLTAEDQALARDLCAQRLAGNWQRYAYGLWLLPEAREDYLPAAGGTSVVDRIVARGTGAIPLLIAMVGDETLTATLSSESSYQRYGYGTPSDAAPEEIERQLFSQMQRPVLRGEVARALLTPLLPGGEDFESRPDRLGDEELRQETRAWHDKIKGKSQREIAMVYVQEGSRQQKQYALRHLIKTSPKGDLAGLEGLLVDAEDPENSFDIVLEYLHATGATGTNALAGRYIAKLRAATEAQLNDMRGNERYRQSMLQNMSNRIEQLQVALSAEPPEAMVKALASGEKDASEVYGVLMRRMEKMDPEATLDLLLKAAASASDAEARRGVLGLLSAVNYRFQRKGGGREAAKPPDVARHAALWKQLLATDDGDTNFLMGMGQENSTALAAAGAILSLYGKSDLEERRDMGLLYQLGGRGRKVIVAAAQALLDGKADAALVPDVDPNGVPDQQRQKMLDGIRKADPARLKAALDGLSLSEWLVLMREAGKDKVLNAKLLPAANVIRTVRAPAGDAEAQALKRELEGTPLNRAAVEKLAAYGRKRLGEKKNVDLSVVRGPCLDGVIVAWGAAGGAKRRGKQAAAKPGPAKPPALVGAVFAGGFAPVMAAWPAGSGPAAQRTAFGATNAMPLVDELMKEALGNLEQDLTAYDDKSRDAFWAKVESIGTKDVNACQPAAIMLSTQSPFDQGGRFSGAFPMEF